MNVLADSGVCGNGLDERGGKVLRVRRGKPDSIDPCCIRHGGDQSGEVPVFMAVGIYVLTEQRDLPESSGGSVTGFEQNRLSDHATVHVPLYRGRHRRSRSYRSLASR